ncbi:hypothetical protein [Streptomyces alboflavus]|uniref:hypothetical protein n=1 Tax=Streptomyces alboflavus TaxID=67267 RepID=UPI000F6563FC|nr:hypothetical protein [Streptomyces alboflavus]
MKGGSAWAKPWLSPNAAEAKDIFLHEQTMKLKVVRHPGYIRASNTVRASGPTPNGRVDERELRRQRRLAVEYAVMGYDRDYVPRGVTGAFAKVAP